MSQRFRLPTSKLELFDLQRQTSELRSEHRVRIALSKLCPRGATETSRQAVLARYGTDAALFAAAGTPCEATIRAYRRDGKRLLNAAIESRRDVWELVEQTANHPKTWYALKAAVQHQLIELMDKFKERIDMWFRADAKMKVDPAFVAACRAAPGKLVAVANFLDATPVGGLPPKFAGMSGRSVNSKSASIRRKPANWREQVAATMTGTLRQAFLIQAVTGCRNEEMVNGVEVMLLDGGMLEFTIAGAKVGKHAGQTSRSFGVAVGSNGIAAMLAALLQVDSPVHTTQLLVGKDKDKVKDAYRKAVARASQRVFRPKKGTQGLSAYSLRHQMKKDAGESLSREDLAMAMGHTSTRSACAYGNGGKAGGSAVAPLDVKATRAVKQRASIHATRAQKSAASASAGFESRARKFRP
jgi:hypothetical protein